MILSSYLARLILILTISWVLSGCRLFSSNQKVEPTPEEPVAIIYDGGFLSGVPCSAPCFFGSSPSVTKKDDLLKNLETYQILPFCNKDDMKKDWARSLACKPNMFFWFDGDDITEISFETHNEISLGKVIERYGNPERVSLSRGGTNELMIVKGVVFKSNQFVLHFTDPGNWKDEPNALNTNFSPEMIILWIDYVDKNTLEKFINDKCSIPWKGYGSYSLNPEC